MDKHEHLHEHTHVDARGNVYTHVHEHGSDEAAGHRHSHSHPEEYRKRVSNRLARAIGHLESVKRMVEDDRDCSEILIQLMAVDSAIKNTGKVILDEHIKHCISDAVDEGDHEAIENLRKAIDIFL